MFENRLVSTGKRGYHKSKCFEARRSNRQEVRQWLQTTPVEDFEDDPIGGSYRERKVYRDGGWNTSTLFRWMDSQDGKHWQDVLTELHRRAPARTEAGRLIRALAEDWIKPDTNGYTWHYIVDDEGIFHKVTPTASNFFLNWHEKNRQLVEVSRWLNGRLIRPQGWKIYWATRAYYIPAGASSKISFRQNCELTEDEYEHFESFHEKIQQEVLARFDEQLAERRRRAA